MKRNIGNAVILLCVVLTVLVWFIFPPENDGRANFQRHYAGEVIGSINIVLMAFALFLATHPKWAKPYFGGLDRTQACESKFVECGMPKDNIQYEEFNFR